MNKDHLAQAIMDLSDLVLKLRGPDGCPWDREQTDSTIKMYLLEEAYEVLDAIERGTSEKVSEELGDLLFHILFLADLAEERGEFDLVEVIEQIKHKMIRRHPHVFGGAHIESPAEVSQQWQEIKRTEKGASETIHPWLEAVPTDLPALMRAHRLIERALKIDNDLKRGEKIWEKVNEDYEDLQSAVAEQDRERIGNILGDLLFGLANLARHYGFNAENVLRGSNQTFLENYNPDGAKVEDTPDPRRPRAKP